MKICFYNLLHIGDIYFSSLYVRNICNLNKDIEFTYCVPYGHYFFNNIPNCKHICPYENKYSEYRTIKDRYLDGYEDYIYNDAFFFLKNLLMWNKCSDICIYNNEETLFINMYNHTDYILSNNLSREIIDTFDTYNQVIHYINKKYNIQLYIDDDIYCKDNFMNTINELKYTDKLQDEFILSNEIKEELNDSIFVFNFITRSVHTDVYEFNNIFNQEIYQNEKLIFADYSNCTETIRNRLNTKFIDREFNIKKNSTCKNLIDMWNIAIHCKKIIIIPTGSSWTFLHKLNEIKENQLYYYYNNPIYTHLQQLNQLIEYYQLHTYKNTNTHINSNKDISIKIL